ncbi:Rossman fold protein, TIGR00730 family [Candidatus Gottesmanbacteria bacterium RBG_13_37_7]|uniref:Cytokinin riboside 5'-monophosphate phosphoribohydrolase n=1 Tax=Candidatus Gottesmanbacteria bacterium RBG_13_37_7 TaxID=1798369 RepID=A0A1F5YJV9_9BACT|nr:MAG: Rossman fold protein, TIGR00730 family [Candidatus Gottesmanbacteria bacterium RBG_13_37_7]
MGKNIVIFAGNDVGSLKPKYYLNLAYQTGKLLGKAGFTVVTGGGPGLMNEASKGACEAGGQTVGVCLEISGRKQSVYLKEKYFYRKLNNRQKKLISLGQAFIALPGGIGTYYEIMEILALKRKKEIPLDYPLILVSEYFRIFHRLMQEIANEGFASKEIDLFYKLVRNPEDAVGEILKYRL